MTAGNERIAARYSEDGGAKERLDSLGGLGRVDNQQVQMKAAESATNDENRSESLS